MVNETKSASTPSAPAGFSPSPAKDYAMLLNQFNSLVGLVNTLEKTQSMLNKELHKQKAEINFLERILDSISDAVQGMEGFVWYQGEYFDTVEDVFNQCLGIEFIKEKNNAS